MKAFLFLALFTCLTNVTRSQTVYRFTGNGPWSETGNWSGSIKPPLTLPAGDTIYISPSPTDSCVLDVAQTISHAASIIVSAGAHFFISNWLNIVNPALPGARLLRVYEIDTASQAATDTTTRWTLFYDIAGRLTRDSISTVLANGISTVIISYEYAGSEKRAFKKTVQKYFGNSGLLSKETSFCNFLDDRYQNDSALYEYPGLAPGTSKTSFTYHPDYILRNFQNNIPQINYSAIETAKIYQVKQNGSIIYQIDTMYTTANGQPAGEQVFETSISYLPNPNPFYFVAYPANKEYYNHIGIGHIVTENASYMPAYLISQQVSTFGNVSYSYSFRPDGYPATAIVTLQYPDTTPYQTKLVFEYAN